MATTIIAQPQDFTPAYNECKFIIDSTNKNKSGFRYIFEVFDSVTNGRIGYYKALPTFGTGYGEQDLSKLLSNSVSFDFNPSITTFYDAENSYFGYDVKFGEEYIFDLSYTASLTDNAGNVRITATHPFVIGDQINIVQGAGGAVANPGVEGLHTVIAITSTTDFTINALWSGVTDATIDGVVEYADKRKTINLNITNTLEKFVFNGVYPWLEFPYWDEDTYNTDGVTKEWLTDQPTSFSSTPGQDLWLNIKDRGTVTGGNKRAYFENDNGDVFYKNLSSNDYIKGVAVGPNNYGSLTVVSGTAPLVKNDTTSYEVWYSDGVFNPVKSVKYKVNIDRRMLISESHIVFLDRLGSWSSFAFQLKAYEKGNITRETYNQDVPGAVIGGEWGYKSYEQGTVNINTEVTKLYDLSTNFMTEAEGEYFQQLLTSPQTYIKNVLYHITEDGAVLFDENGCVIHVPESTEYVSCNVTTNTFEVFKQRNKNLIKQSIQVRIGNNDTING
jgi:hypothetical protein